MDIQVNEESAVYLKIHYDGYYIMIRQKEYFYVTKSQRKTKRMILDFLKKAGITYLTNDFVECVRNVLRPARLNFKVFKTGPYAGLGYKHLWERLGWLWTRRLLEIARRSYCCNKGKLTLYVIISCL